MRVQQRDRKQLSEYIEEWGDEDPYGPFVAFGIDRVVGDTPPPPPQHLVDESTYVESGSPETYLFELIEDSAVDFLIEPSDETTLNIQIVDDVSGSEPVINETVRGEGRYNQLELASEGEYYVYIENKGDIDCLIDISIFVTPKELLVENYPVDRLEKFVGNRRVWLTKGTFGLIYINSIWAYFILSGVISLSGAGVILYAIGNMILNPLIVSKDLKHSQKQGPHPSSPRYWKAIMILSGLPVIGIFAAAYHVIVRGNSKKYIKP